MAASMVVQEAIGAGDIQEIGPNGFVHLLDMDAHSIQSSTGYTASPLNTRHPYSFERWIRARWFGTYATIGMVRFWADNLIVPPGWDVRYGVSPSYQPPTLDPSSIATAVVPTNLPSGPNVSASLMVGPGTNYSPWVVIQARVTDPSLVSPGSLLGQTGTEVIVPTMIHYHFGWNES